MHIVNVTDNTVGANGVHFTPHVPVEIDDDNGGQLLTRRPDLFVQVESPPQPMTIAQPQPQQAPTPKPKPKPRTPTRPRSARGKN